MSKYLETGKYILSVLNGASYSAYFVGGYVRDYLLDIKSHDIDITTSATVDQITNLFDNVKYTGKKFGGVTVIINQFKYEVTTYRTDGFSIDNRHPVNVTFTTNIDEDLSRRDFTINALCMDVDGKIIDQHNGKQDLKDKLIRTINNPTKRFNEDALRILRAFRFVSKLGLDIEELTARGIKESKYLIKTISIERVMIELNKIFIGKYKNKALKLMSNLGVLDELYGLKKGLLYLSDKPFNLSALETFTLCFIKDEINDIWRFSNKDIRLIKQLIMICYVTKEDSFNKMIVYVNKKDTCLMANNINVALGYKDQSDLIIKLNNELPIKDVCDLKFKGEDILKLTKLKKKSYIGLIIDDLKINVINGILENEYGILKEYALNKVDELDKEDYNE